MANKDMLLRLILDSSQYNKGLSAAQQQVEGFVNKNMSLSNVMGTAAKAIGAFAAAAGMTAGAMEGLSKTIASTQTATDAVGRTMQTAKSMVDSFFFAMATGDFSGFLEGLQQVEKYAKAAYNALDDLGTFDIFKGANVSEINEQRDVLRAQIRSQKRYEIGDDGEVHWYKMTAKDLEEAKQKLQELDKQYLDLMIQTQQKAAAASKSLAKQIVTENHAIGTEEELDEAIDYYLRNYNNYAEVTEKLNRMKAEIKANTSMEKVLVNDAGGPSISTYQYVPNERAKEIMGSAEYKNMNALYEIGDDKLKQIMSYRMQAAGATSEVNRAMQSDSRLTNSTSGQAKVEGNAEAKPKDNSLYAMPAKAKDNIDALTVALTEMGSEFDDTMLEEVELVGDLQNKWREFTEDLENSSTGIEEKLAKAGDLFRALGSAIGGSAGEGVAAIGNLMDTMTSLVPVIQSVIAMHKLEELAAQGDTTAQSQLAAAKAGQSVAGIPFVGPALAVAAITTVLGMVGAIKAISFAEGGVVPGQNYQDGIAARVSSGEMIINQHDQAELWNSIKNGNGGGGSSQPYLTGEVIWMGMRNYLQRTGRGEIVTTK